jgi:hypothetical protein
MAVNRVLERVRGPPTRWIGMWCNSEVHQLIPAPRDVRHQCERQGSMTALEGGDAQQLLGLYSPSYLAHGVFLCRAECTMASLPPLPALGAQNEVAPWLALHMATVRVTNNGGGASEPSRLRRAPVTHGCTCWCLRHPNSGKGPPWSSPIMATLR